MNAGDRVGRFATITTSMEVDFERRDRDGLKGLEKMQ